MQLEKCVRDGRAVLQQRCEGPLILSPSTLSGIIRYRAAKLKATDHCELCPVITQCLAHMAVNFSVNFRNSPSYLRS
jgi:hypothetical protein